MIRGMLPRQDEKPVRLSDFARRLLDEWTRRGWPVEGVRSVVAVSGGADSVALLLALDELVRRGRVRAELYAAHLDHGLRGARGEDDARWVGELARTLGYECLTGRASVAERARERRDNLEQAARGARYEFLVEAARRCGARAALTAHTLDDQAETVLLRLLRGSGPEGLGGMHPERALDPSGDVLLIRPLLSWARRADTETYCHERGVEFRADEMNEDERFARVRLRRKVMPLLETFNPRAVEAVARAAGLLREDAWALDALAAKLLEDAGESSDVVATDEEAAADEREAAADEREAAADEREAATHENDAQGKADGPPPLSVQVLAHAPAALRKRALRQWIASGRGDLRRLELAHLRAVEKLLTGERGGRVAELPGGCWIERRRGHLIFRRKKS